jgi:hypothetical protein
LSCTSDATGYMGPTNWFLYFSCLKIFYEEATKQVHSIVDMLIFMEVNLNSIALIICMYYVICKNL